MVRWMALTVVGLALVMVLPHELLGAQPVPVGRLRMLPVALLSLLVVACGWIYGVTLLARSARRWARDATCRVWALAFVILPPVGLCLAVFRLTPLALLLGLVGSAGLVAWALRVDARFAFSPDDAGRTGRLP